MAMQTNPGGKVDRQTTTPFHLKLFYRTGSFHSTTDFPTTPLPPHLQIYTWPTCTLRELSHLLSSALPSLLPSPATGTRLCYRLLYPDTHSSYPGAPGRYLSKELGDVVVSGDDDLSSNEEEEGGRGGRRRGRMGEENGKDRGVGEGGGRGAGAGAGEGAVIPPSSPMAGHLSGSPEKTLQEARFVIGDFISCAIFPPGPDGSVAPAQQHHAGRGGGGLGPRGRGGEYMGGGSRGGGYGGFGGGENGGGGYRGRGRGGGGFGGGFNGAGRVGDGGVPMGEWRRGERVPEGRGGGYGRGRGRGY